jgi:hypothetical protein
VITIAPHGPAPSERAIACTCRANREPLHATNEAPPLNDARRLTRTRASPGTRRPPRSARPHSGCRRRA